MKRGNNSWRRWRPVRPFPFSLQAAGASDRTAARVIFVILSILSALPFPDRSRCRLAR